MANKRQSQQQRKKVGGRRRAAVSAQSTPFEPRAMQTTMVRGPSDPPQTSENFVGMKRFRKKVQLAAGVGSMTIADLAGCIPFSGTFFFRIMKMSVYASASANSLLTVVFPLTITSGIGDQKTFVDEGTQGSIRPNIHLIPNFDFRTRWFQNDVVGTIATFGGTASDLLVVDVTLEYRTATQTCPAYALALGALALQ